MRTPQDTMNTKYLQCLSLAPPQMQAKQTDRNYLTERENLNNQANLEVRIQTGNSHIRMSVTPLFLCKGTMRGQVKVIKSQIKAAFVERHSCLRRAAKAASALLVSDALTERGGWHSSQQNESASLTFDASKRRMLRNSAAAASVHAREVCLFIGVLFITPECAIWFFQLSVMELIQNAKNLSLREVN